MKLALIYDRVNKFGGAERILLALHRLWPDAPLFTAVYDQTKAPWAKKFDVRPSFLQNFPGAKSNHELYPWLTPLAFENFDLNGFDVVLSVTSAEAKAVITKPQTLHLCYCLTPTRYLWSHSKHYLESSLGWGLKPMLNYLKRFDLVAANRPDAYAAISQTVAKRIKRYYRRTVPVIYPPIDTAKFARQVKNVSLNNVPVNYHLLVGRLVSYKSLDLAIKAFNRLKLPLVIVGHGREQAKLIQMSGPTITFFNKVSENDLIYLYQNARALIMPQEEDFGLAAVEAQAAGTPILALNRGGAIETVVNGKTGILFDRPAVDSLTATVKKSNSRAWDRKVIKAQAKKFDVKHFNQAFTKWVEEEWLKHRQNLKQKY